MEHISQDIIRKKLMIEKEFNKVKPEGSTINVTPILPDKVEIEVSLNGNHKISKVIHCNEEPFLKRLLKFHGCF
jgi:hypothetical protein